MFALIDAHTHSLQPDNPLAIINLSLLQAQEVLNTSFRGYCSVGIHPWDVHKTDSSALSKLYELAKDKRVVAIGECGLDKNSRATIKEQEFYFERQINISEELKKPLVIHSVAAFNEIIMLKKHLRPVQTWMIHGFRGKPELAKQLIDHGFVLSFGEKYNPASVEITPLDRLCVETDESTLPIDDIYHRIAQTKGCLPSEINQAARIFKIYTY